MLVAHDLATLYRWPMKKPTTPKPKGDPARGARLKDCLVPRAKERGYTMEAFTAELGLTKAAATGWFKTGSISVGTLFLIQEKIGIPAREILEALGYPLDVAEEAEKPERLTPTARNLIDLIASADTSQSVSSDSWKHLAGVVRQMMASSAPPKPAPRNLRK